MRTPAVKKGAAGALWTCVLTAGPIEGNPTDLTTRKPRNGAVCEFSRGGCVRSEGYGVADEASLRRVYGVMFGWVTGMRGWAANSKGVWGRLLWRSPVAHSVPVSRRTLRAATGRRRSQGRGRPQSPRTPRTDQRGSLPAAVPAQVRVAGEDGAGRGARECWRRRADR